MKILYEIFLWFSVIIMIGITLIVLGVSLILGFLKKHFKLIIAVIIIFMLWYVIYYLIR